MRRAASPGRLDRNEGAWVFTEIGQEAGLDFAPLPAWPAGSSAHWVDYDNDEDLDLFVGTTPPSTIDLLYQNGGNWLDIALEGTVSNRSAVGARVVVAAVGAWYRGRADPTAQRLER